MLVYKMLWLRMKFWKEALKYKAIKFPWSKPVALKFKIFFLGSAADI